MRFLELPGDRESLAFEYQAPAGSRGVTFVFFNALTGSAGGWRTEIVPALADAGHGYLLFDYRSQGESGWSGEEPLTPALLASDAEALLRHVAPERAVPVGMSIGGLFAVRCILNGVSAAGLVLINTLRVDGPRLSWVNDAVLRSVEIGGLDLFRDLFSPLIFNEEWLDAAVTGRQPHGSSYAPLDPSSGTCSLLKHAAEADWDVPWEKLALPVLVVSGLQDRVFYDAGTVAGLAARLPDGRRLDLPDAGHMVPVERPAALIRSLKDFARDIVTQEA